MRIRCVFLAAVLSGLSLLASGPHTVTLDFDGESPGSLPVGWVGGVTGKGAPRWLIFKDPSAPSKPNVLAQTGYGTYPFCVDSSSALKDGFVAVKFKALMGKEDQAGGLVWRFLDGNDYYVARANALENNVAIYRTVGGTRKVFKEVEAKVAAAVWHSLRVDFMGTHFTVAFDGKKVLEAEDPTFAGPGAVGVWTKADSVTYFDDFEYGPP